MVGEPGGDPAKLRAFQYDQDSGELHRPEVGLEGAWKRVEKVVEGRDLRVEKADKSQFGFVHGEDRRVFATLVGPKGGRVELCVYLGSSTEHSGYDGFVPANALVDVGADLAEDLDEGVTARLGKYVEEGEVYFGNNAQARDDYTRDRFAGVVGDKAKITFTGELWPGGEPPEKNPREVIYNFSFKVNFSLTSLGRRAKDKWNIT